MFAGLEADYLANPPSSLDSLSLLTRLLARRPEHVLVGLTCHPPPILPPSPLPPYRQYRTAGKLTRVISGHLGWIRSVAVEPGNQWFATGAGDRVIKIWDLASGELKVSLTGHISTVRGLAVSPRHPYLFSAGEDKVRARSPPPPPNCVVGSSRGSLYKGMCLLIHLLAGFSFVSQMVKCWDLETNKVIRQYHGHLSGIYALEYAPSLPDSLPC